MLLYLQTKFATLFFRSNWENEKNKRPKKGVNNKNNLETVTRYIKDD